MNWEPEASRSLLCPITKRVDAGWPALFLHCSKLPPRNENLLKKNPYQAQGRGRFSYITVNFYPEVRIY